MARTLAFALLACALLAPSPAAARPAVAGGPGILASKLLWATVDVCDTAKHPNTIGVRGSMPGTGNAKQRMFLRIRIEYRSRADRGWHLIDQGGDSGWLALGSGRFKVREAGANFAFVPPADGSGVRLRGDVSFEWRRGAKVVLRASLRTSRGHVAAAGADPAGYTASSCVVR